MARTPPSAGPPAASGARGFSLIELVVVIVVTGVMASAVGLFIAGPIQSFFDQARRGELVDAAQVALTRMGRDLRAALPNSVRISGGALELLLTVDGDRYRTEPPGAAADRLDLTAVDDSFNTFAPLSPPAVVPPIGTPYQVTGALAIYPLQQAGANPYVASDGVMTPPGNLTITPVTLGTATEYRISLTAAAVNPPGAHRFPFDSPTRRVFLVLGPVTWRCEAGELVRYDSYVVTDPQPVPPPAPRLRTVIVRNVETCNFQYAAGTAERNAVVSTSLVLADAGERVRLLRQVQVENTP